MSFICQIVGKSAIRLQGLNRRLYKKIPEYFYAYEMLLWKLNYKNLLQTLEWEQGVNEKTFLDNQPSPYNKIAGWEHSGHKQTEWGHMFNMILQDGTRSDNPMTNWNGEVLDSYDYFLPQNKKITAVTICYSDYYIYGFRFHLSDGSEWDIGYVEGDTVTVNIADNEVIVGFKAKSSPYCPARYVEWQFITA
jgi:hypothetical protein